MNKLHIYNTLTRKKEEFVAIEPPHVGMYVCGPTVYGDAHLGHARAAITFDIVYRYLKYLKYKVRYVRNITDVGHLENDADAGEDKVQKKARLEEIEPMEVVQYYVNRYHENMQSLNVLPPNIEPHASGHIPEQIDLIKKIEKNGYAYESNGSVYFNIEKYNEKHDYGVLSNRKIEDLYASTRELEGQKEKRNSFDFALWKKADDNHLMRWKSEWSDGYPGWHLECSAMGNKYLGKSFDIHGGGLDLQFPHHESEIAQNVAAFGDSPVHYWMHNNMITINGKKMSKSLNNFITLYELFDGSNTLLDKAYSPMTVRFFILQAHYRSPLDFSNDALAASEKGFAKLMTAIQTLSKIKHSEKSTVDINSLISNALSALNDDFNTPILIANLFNIVKLINSIDSGAEQITKQQADELSSFLNDIIFDVLGFRDEMSRDDKKLTNSLIEMLLNIRQDAKDDKDFEKSDNIRDKLNELGIIIKDKKGGADWEIK